MYKDTAAFWQFITPEQNMEVRNVDIQIVLPTGIPAEDMNGFVSGSLYAEKHVLKTVHLASLRSGSSLMRRWKWFAIPTLFSRWQENH